MATLFMAASKRPIFDKEGFVFTPSTLYSELLRWLALQPPIDLIDVYVFDDIYEEHDIQMVELMFKYLTDHP